MLIAMAAGLLGVASLALVAVVLWPLLAGEPGDSEAGSSERERRRDVDEEIGRVLDAVREIELDHRAGNLSDADFAELDGAERARAVELMRQRDRIGGER